MATDLQFTKERIRAIREKLGLTQVQFAKRFGFSQPSVSLWESGTVMPMSYPALKGLLEAERQAEEEQG